MEQGGITEEQIMSLVAKSREGDTQSFSKIYDHYFASVYRYAAIRVPREVAEDLVAEVFVKAWEKLHTFKERKNVPFGAWLFRIARNEVIDTYRMSKTWEEVPEDLSDPDELNRADAGVNRHYVLKTVRGALAKLPKRYREVLSLCFIADLSHEEAAKVLRCSVGAIRVMKFRALQQLKDILPPEIKENL
ncbi:RNA polymerase sigma factor [Patescibacteria group bacterium]|nr:RNA polymerase sigma factor [Patescibacteria group bacterium]MBU1123036.1 RNA polymerase sigma factor [Patescibacteria group bacterium]MBU1911814.1 RNA polymerase sigma factor [Patescibacteria group bacterium]